MDLQAPECDPDWSCCRQSLRLRRPSAESGPARLAGRWACPAGAASSADWAEWTISARWEAPFRAWALLREAAGRACLVGGAIAGASLAFACPSWDEARREVLETELSFAAVRDDELADAFDAASEAFASASAAAAFGPAFEGLDVVDAEALAGHHLVPLADGAWAFPAAF